MMMMNDLLSCSMEKMMMTDLIELVEVEYDDEE
jgi:hypothetical protein